MYGNERNLLVTYFNIGIILGTIPSQLIQLRYVRPSIWIPSCELAWSILVMAMAGAKNSKTVRPKPNMHRGYSNYSPVICSTLLRRSAGVVQLSRIRSFARELVRPNAAGKTGCIVRAVECNRQHVQRISPSCSIYWYEWEIRVKRMAMAVHFRRDHLHPDCCLGVFCYSRPSQYNEGILAEEAGKSNHSDTVWSASC